MIDDDKPKRFDAAALDEIEKEDGEQPAIKLTPKPEPTARRTAERGAQPAEDAGDMSNLVDMSRLGTDLASAMQNGEYHPVILFGTNNSGKTSILMSLFSTIANEPVLETGLSLCDPILGTQSDVSKALHREARITFEVKTQAFLAGEKIPKTSTLLPFFIPVEFRPPNGPSVKFAFLESNGEWYRPLVSDGSSIADAVELYPKLRKEIETFVSSFQNGITFLYAAPVTQGEVYAAAENVHDAREVDYAGLALNGVLQSYDRIRANGRSEDKHHLLVTKWDALSVRATDRSEGIASSNADVQDFLRRKYPQALSSFQGLSLNPTQRFINAYCAGMITERGALRPNHDDPVRGVIASYPVRLWDVLYRNALSANGVDPISPFKEPPRRSSISRFVGKLLDLVSG